MNRRIVMGVAFLILGGALVACGADDPTPQDAANDAATDARDAKVPTRYCYEFGGPSDLEPDAADAGINPNVCDAGGECVPVTGSSNYFCFYPPPKK